MYRYSQQVRMNLSNYKLQRRVMAVLIVLLLAGCIALGVITARGAAYQKGAKAQYTQRMISCAASAKAVADKLSNSAQSDTAAKLAQIRQYVFAVDQLNGLAVSLGGEGARVVPQEAFDALYDDIDSYFTVIQTSTTSVLETRTLLNNHLAALKAIMEQ